MRWKEYVDATVARYDRWIAEGRMTHSSRVVPVGRSFKLRQWVMPGNQVIEYLQASPFIALADCMCRALARRCDRPLDVCLYLGAFAERNVARGRARKVSLDEARAAVERADENGLVHLTLYNEHREVFAVCSCCECCCHDLYLLKGRGRTDLVARSEYVAVTDRDACLHCGACVDRCVFGARTLDVGRLMYAVDRCYGCGLCVSVCPVGATGMEARQPRGGRNGRPPGEGGHGWGLDLRKVPLRYSRKARSSSSSVFMTIGPRQATGSRRGAPAKSRNRTPPGPPRTVTRSPAPYRTTWSAGVCRDEPGPKRPSPSRV
ncbi:MAG: hypothetical protein GXP50_09225 [Deltaproteobacteria bacterium]|nr:hypothetical protein [Deltaproteobacteria bacterium]